MLRPFHHSYLNRSNNFGEGHKLQVVLCSICFLKNLNNEIHNKNEYIMTRYNNDNNNNNLVLMICHICK